MHWNHRIVRKWIDNEPWYSIREVFYNDDNTVYAYTQDAIAPEGESTEILRQTLEWMLKCLDNPVLDQQEIKCVDPDPGEDDWEGEDWDYDI